MNRFRNIALLFQSKNWTFYFGPENRFSKQESEMAANFILTGNTEGIDCKSPGWNLTRKGLNLTLITRNIPSIELPSNCLNLADALNNPNFNRFQLRVCGKDYYGYPICILDIELQDIRFFTRLPICSFSFNVLKMVDN